MKSARVAVIVLCMALLILPSAGMPVFGSQDSGAEYRVLSDYPAVIDEDGKLNGAFAGDFEKWLCDRFAFRNEAVRADAWLNYRLLASSANDQVIAGKENWLYFTPTVPDYTGEGRLSQAQLDVIAANLRAFSEMYARRGARVFLAIIPNKSTLYPQYMPGRFHMRADEGNIPLLREACQGLPLTWIDLVTPLREAASGDRLIYYRTDTHWNALGAAIAAHAVLDAMGANARDYAVEGDVPFAEGDLARLAGLPGMIVEDVSNVVPGAPLPAANYAGRAFTLTGNGAGRLTVFRDSFGTAIGPWLTDAYERCEMIWSYPLEGGHAADDVLVLICERNIREYLSAEPLPDDGEPVDTDDGDDEVSRQGGAFSRENFYEDEAGDDDDFFDDGDDDFFDDGDDDFFDDGDDDEPSEDEDAGEADEDDWPDDEADADDADFAAMEVYHGI